MKQYKVSFVLELDDDAPNPIGWVIEGVVQSLEPGEDVVNFEVELVE